MKTIRQIAEEIGVSKQAVQKRIAREPLYTRLSPYLYTEKGTKYIGKAGESIIKSAFNKNEPTTSSIDASIDETNNQNTQMDIVINMLKEELEIKNEQIKELNARLAESNTALIAAQQSAQEALRAEQLLHADTKKMFGLPNPTEPEEPSPPPKSFWSKIFKRKHHPKNP